LTQGKFTLEAKLMLRFDPERVRQNARQADTEDLLDRVTVYRAGMEAEALVILEGELHLRGITPDDIDRHAREREATSIPLPDGTVRKCSFCVRPAVRAGWSWHKLWGLVPLFPRHLGWCDRHLPGGMETP
jgi:hypothetical protein